MSEQSTPGTDTRTPEQIQADLARTRLELTSTVDELVDRLDPRNQIEEVRASVRAKFHAFTEDLRNKDPKALGIAAAGVAVVVLTVVLARRGE